jgi:hypothetical protein
LQAFQLFPCRRKLLINALGSERLRFEFLTQAQGLGAVELVDPPLDGRRLQPFTFQFPPQPLRVRLCVAQTLLEGPTLHALEIKLERMTRASDFEIDLHAAKGGFGCFPCVLHRLLTGTGFGQSQLEA